MSEAQPQAKGGAAVAVTERAETAAQRAAATTVAPFWRRIVARLSRRERWFPAALIFCYAYFLMPANTNSLSRYDMVVALANGTAIIDPNAANTIDVSFYAGHYYSPRSLGPSLLAVPVYKVISALSSLTHTQPTITFYIAYFNLFTAVPVCVIAALVFAAFVARLRPELAETPLPVVAASAFALGTLFFPFSTVFFSHAFAGGLIFIGFYLLYRARSQPHPERFVLGGGLLAGYAVISEYPLAVVALLLCGYVWAAFPPTVRGRMLALFIAATLPSALLLAGYNWLAFGSPLHMSYAYVSNGEFQGQHSGLFGISLPSLDGLVQILVWPRGLLVESPFLALVVLGFVRWWRSGARPPAEAVLCIAISIAYPLLISSYFLPMAGENLPGPRLLVPMLPFTCLALAWVVDEPRRWLRAGFATLLAFAFAITALYVVVGVHEYHTYLTYPFVDLFLPTLGTGEVPALNAPTPQSLGTEMLQLPWLASQRVFLVPFVAWCGYMVYRLVRAPATRADSRPNKAPAHDASPSSA